MSRSWRILSLLFVSLLALAVVSAVLAAGNGQIALRPSNGYPAASGTAQYQNQPGQREFQIEIDHIRSLAGQYLNIYIDGTRLGTARVNGRGVAELSRNSELAQRVPQVGTGTTVTVRTSHAATVVSGTF